MEINTHWPLVKKIFKQSFSSSFHFSIATVDKNGQPHITPVGSLILGKPGHGIYFEAFTTKLQNNLKTNNHVSILAVNSNKWFWLKSLFKGRFSEPPALRLQGEAGELREATEFEIELWHRRVKAFKLTKGHKIMWKDMTMVREITFSKIDPVYIGPMTKNLNG